MKVQTVREFSVSAVFTVDRTMEQVVEATARDKDLEKLVECITKGFPKEKTRPTKELRPFWNDRFKLTVMDSVIMCNERIVVPKELQL